MPPTRKSTKDTLTPFQKTRAALAAHGIETRKDSTFTISNRSIGGGVNKTYKIKDNGSTRNISTPRGDYGK